MKTVKEWMNKWETTLGMGFEEVLEEAQKDAYNQALEDATNFEKVKTYYDENIGWCIEKDSILKLRK